MRGVRRSFRKSVSFRRRRSKLRRKSSFDSFDSPFLGYASTDWVSACSPLTAVEVAEAFHRSVCNITEKPIPHVYLCLLWFIKTSVRSPCQILCLVNVYIKYEKSYYKWLYSFIHVACVAPKINSVVIKTNKPSTGFFKRHGLAGGVNGNAVLTIRRCAWTDKWNAWMDVALCVYETYDSHKSASTSAWSLL